VSFILVVQQMLQRVKILIQSWKVVVPCCVNHCYCVVIIVQVYVILMTVSIWSLNAWSRVTSIIFLLSFYLKYIFIVLYNHRICNYNHPCEKICFMDCGKCAVPLIKKLPCGHQLTLPCFVDVITFSCEEMVDFITIHLHNVLF